MTGYINWLQNNQIVHGDALPTKGNAADDYETLTSGATSNPAPEGALMAVIWNDAPFKFSATNLSDANLMASDKEIAWIADSPYEIINITPGQTTITITDL